MKKLIITTLLLQTILSFGQTDCKNNVSTNPNAPTNNNLPYLFNSSNQLELTAVCVKSIIFNKKTNIKPHACFFSDADR